MDAVIRSPHSLETKQTCVDAQASFEVRRSLKSKIAAITSVNRRSLPLYTHAKRAHVGCSPDRVRNAEVLGIALHLSLLLCDAGAANHWQHEFQMLLLPPACFQLCNDCVRIPLRVQELAPGLGAIQVGQLRIQIQTSLILTLQLLNDLS